MPRSRRAQIEKMLSEAQALTDEIAHDAATAATPDPVKWAEQALGFPLDHWQRRIMRSEHKRLICVAARQSGKSVVTGCKTAYEAATKPHLRVVAVAPSFRQASLLADKIENGLHANKVPYTRLRV